MSGSRRAGVRRGQSLRSWVTAARGCRRPLDEGPVSMAARYDSLRAVQDSLARSVAGGVAINLELQLNPPTGGATSPTQPEPRVRTAPLRQQRQAGTSCTAQAPAKPSWQGTTLQRSKIVRWGQPNLGPGPSMHRASTFGRQGGSRWAGQELGENFPNIAQTLLPREEEVAELLWSESLSRSRPQHHAALRRKTTT